LTVARSLWWHDQGITRFVAGVFEGGGAKGVLYRGALEAMVEDAEQRCWFSAVAGASAGAITATLIAAGLEPAQVADEAAKGLRTLRKPTLLSGSLRLRDGASYLDQDALSDWLHDVVERQAGAARVTFAELYRMTGIELDVVAVDLNRQRLVVFNYELTPTCTVAEAVVASTAIPMAFEWRPLRLPEPPFGIVVDGGVMANFPTFVFKDRSFRKWAGLPPHPDSVPVVGFLLAEQGRVGMTKPDLYREASFWPPMSQWGKVIRAIVTSGEEPLPEDFELERRKFRPRRDEPSTAQKLARALAKPLRVALWPAWKLLFDWMPAFLRWNAGNVRGNWPEPRSPVLRSLVQWFDGVLAGTRPWGFLLAGFLAASLCLGVGAYFVAWRPLADHVGDVINGDVGVVGAIIGLAFLALWSLVPIYAWMVLSIVFFVSWLIHRNVQMTGYGLVKTFLHGPAAPLWAGTAADDHVVRLPVPPGITTLEARESEVPAAIEAARAATRAELRQLFSPS
jgi:Patatin-like phospholipase